VRSGLPHDGEQARRRSDAGSHRWRGHRRPRLYRGAILTSHHWASNIRGFGAEPHARGHRIEAFDQILEILLELWIVRDPAPRGQMRQPCDNIRRLTFFPSDLMDHAEAVVAVMHVGPALDQRLRGVLGVVGFPASMRAITALAAASISALQSLQRRG